MSYSSVHPEYSRLIPDVQMVRRCVDGEVKEYRELYLPADFSKDEGRYGAYLERAYFLGATGQALSQTVGMAFRKPPKQVEVPTQLEPLIDNIDNTGQSLEMIAKWGLSELEQTPRFALLAEYTQGEAATRADEQAMGARPYLAPYTFEEFINWKYSVINGVKVLTLAVLVELVDDGDEFAHNYQKQYRVLRLTDGVYTQQVYSSTGEAGELITPRMAGGRPFDHIPLTLVNSSDNKPHTKLSKPPLEPLARVNLAHYQVSADHMENLHVHGQLTLGVTSDLDNEAFKAANPGGVKVGARTGHYLGQSGAFHTATAPESSSLRTAIQDIEQQIIYMGGKLVTQGGQAQTAEASRIDAGAESSVIAGLIKNLSHGLTTAVKDMALFAGANPDEIAIELNTTLMESTITAQDAEAITGLIDRQVISTNDGRDMVRNGRIDIPDKRTNEDIQIDVANDLASTLENDNQ